MENVNSLMEKFDFLTENVGLFMENVDFLMEM